MTKKDYKLIARCLHEARSDTLRYNLDASNTIEVIIEKPQKELKFDNANFDCGRFERAVILGEGI